VHEQREPQPTWRRVAAGLKGSRTIPRTRWTARSVWKPTPGSLTSLVVGLWLFGTGDAILLAADLGATPWTVLAQGVSVRTGLSIGITTFIVSVTVLLLWIPLKQRPGLGTVLNIVVISIAIEVMYTVLPRPEPLGVRLMFVLVGTATIGLGSGFYLTAGHGPGPRDGWMTGLHHRTGWPVGRIRLFIEVTVLTGGWLLGGTVGVGTAMFALLIGQFVAMGLAFVRRIAPPVAPH
jgi:uncharacterized membrane protein YczE